ncbi:hypothetical protein M0R45_009381 [Rubus argutus]|uniref:Secreted protein n=1 Tax=Rubus argutus TaxID=59490 RepID=A0AAW1Y6V4_RUBAR
MVVICTVITVVIMVMIMIRPWVMLYGGDGHGEAHGQRWLCFGEVSCFADEDGNGESQIEADHEFLLQLEMRSFCFWNVVCWEDKK